MLIIITDCHCVDAVDARLQGSFRVTYEFRREVPEIEILEAVRLVDGKEAPPDDALFSLLVENEDLEETLLAEGASLAFLEDLVADQDGEPVLLLETCPMEDAS